MKVLITGGGGFLGQLLCRRLLGESALAEPSTGIPIDAITLLDRSLVDAPEDGRVTLVEGDLSDAALLTEALSDGIDLVFHLAAVVSGAAEADFDLGMQVNVDATRLLLQRCRSLGHRPRLVFASSVAIFAHLARGAIVRDDAAATPANSYGMQKAVGELLVADYSRKGWIDGRSIRLPTICVRPGKPNKAASSFASSLVREPLAGLHMTCPVHSDTVMWLMSPQRAVDSLLRAATLREDEFGEPRMLNLPGLSVSVGEMHAALRAVAGAEVACRVRFESDPAIERIVASWPGRFEAARALRLGFRGDADFADVIHAYMRAQAGAAAP